MGIVIGVVVGYAMGTRAGEEGWGELVEALRTIGTSEEVHDLIAAGFSLTRDLVGRGQAVAQLRRAA